MQYSDTQYRKSSYSGHVMTTYIDTGETRQDGCEGVGKVMVKLTTSKGRRGVDTTAQQYVVYPSGSEQTMIFGNGYCVLAIAEAKVVTEKKVREAHQAILDGMTPDEVVAMVNDTMKRRAA